MSFAHKVMNIEAVYARLAFRMDVGARRRLWLKLAKLLGSGVPIMQAFKSLYDRRREMAKQGDPMLGALEMLRDGVQNGERMAPLLNGWVSNNERMLISAGEQAGETEKALLLAAETMEANRRIRNTVIGGIAYPVVLLLMACAVLYLFGFKITPSFTNVVPAEKFHGIAYAMIVVSKFTQQWFAALLSVAVAAIAVFIVSLPQWRGSYRVIADRYAPYSIYRIVQGSTWLISLAALLSAGLRIENALEQLSDTASPWMHERIQGALYGMRSGLNIGEALSKSGYEFPDKDIIEDLLVFAGLTGFETQLVRMGKEWMSEAVEEIQWRMRIVFGVSVLIMGGITAFMVTGLMAMQLQLSQAMHSSLM